MTCCSSSSRRKAARGSEVFYACGRILAVGGTSATVQWLALRFSQEEDRALLRGLPIADEMLVATSETDLCGRDADDTADGGGRPLEEARLGAVQIPGRGPATRRLPVPNRRLRAQANQTVRPARVEPSFRNPC